LEDNAPTKKSTAGECYISKTWRGKQNFKLSAGEIHPETKNMFKKKEKKTKKF